jgi:hypothetical protein
MLTLDGGSPGGTGGTGGMGGQGGGGAGGCSYAYYSGNGATVSTMSGTLLMPASPVKGGSPNGAAGLAGPHN